MFSPQVPDLPPSLTYCMPKSSLRVWTPFGKTPLNITLHITFLLTLLAPGSEFIHRHHHRRKDPQLRYSNCTETINDTETEQQRR